MFLKSLFWQIINSIIKFFLEVFVFDRKIRRVLKGNWAKFYLKKYVKGKYSYSVPLAKTLLPQDMENPALNIQEEQQAKIQPIWQYWESLDGTIPPLVQACLNSVEKYKGKCTRIFLTPENVKEYIELPEYIYLYKQQGKMCTAHFVDIIRTALLAKYGGIWVDATILFTDTIPEYITNSDLFFFRTDGNCDLDGLCGTNYLLSALKPNHTIWVKTLDAMLSYWKENRFLINYFSHMHIITLICKKHPDLLNKIPFYSFYPVQQLQWELLSEFNQTRWEQLKRMTSVHKLTHKSKVLTKKKNFDTTGTFYEHIIKEFGNEI